VSDDEICLEVESERTSALLQRADAYYPLPAAAAITFHQVHDGTATIVSRRDYEAALSIAAAALSRLISIYTLRDPREGRVVVAVDLATARFALGATQLRTPKETIGELWVSRGEMVSALSLIKRTRLPFSFAEAKNSS
jgi:hypothetical protein